MKFSVTLLLVLCWAGIAQTQDWTWQNPKPTGNDEIFVQMFDASHVVVGGKVYGMKSTDAGLTWALFNPHVSNVIRGWCFASATNCMVVSYSGEVRRTTDGGISWSNVSTGTYDDLAAVGMAGASDAVVVGDGGVAYYTADGGSHWTSAGTGVTSNLSIVCDLDSVHVWAAGDSGVILFSPNGGAVWNSQTSSSTSQLYAGSFSNVRVGTMVGAQGAILHTTDGGVHWHDQSVVSAYDLKGVSQFDSLHADCVGDGGVSYWTTDGGTTWNLANANYSDHKGVGFANASLGITAGRYGRMAQTTDGGKNWTDIFSGDENYFYNVQFLNPNVGLVAGGDLLSTSDGGLVWTEHFSPDPGTSVQWILYYDSTKVLAGYNDSISVSTDNGTTWKEFAALPPGFISHAVAVPRMDSDTMLASANTIKISTDAGATWNTPGGTIPGSTYFRTVAYFDQSHAIAGGNFGVQLYSTDAGFSWAQSPIVTANTIFGVCCVSPSTAFAAADGSILKTIDTGKTWTDILDLPNDNLQSVHSISFSDPNNGTAVGGTGTVVRTTDGGSTWTYPTSWAESSLNGVWSVNANMTFAVGDNGVVIETTDGALAIQLGSFEGTFSLSSGVNLSWSTVSETNDYGFYVLRKTPSGNSYAAVSALIPGSGTSLQHHEYSWSDPSPVNGKNYYELKQVDYNGTFTVSAPIEVNVDGVEGVKEKSGTPHVFALHQNYPNPFNPSTSISFTVAKEERASLKVYDILGREVAGLFDDVAQPGRAYSASLNASGLASGVYYYRLLTASHSDVKKMLLLR